MLASARTLTEPIQELRVVPVPPEIPPWPAELIHPRISACLQRYLTQLATFRRPNTVRTARLTLVPFVLWLQEVYSEVSSVADLRRQHIEDWKLCESTRLHAGHPLRKATISTRLSLLRSFFYYLAVWGWQDAPHRPLIFRHDFPRRDQCCPRFLGDEDTQALLQAARTSSYRFGKVSVVTLLFTGMRVGEFVRLTTDSVIKIGSAEWMRIPVGKLHNDRYVPLHPEVRQVLDECVEHRDPCEKSPYLFARNGGHYTVAGVQYAVARVAHLAGIGHVTPHQLRHTMATQAINNGMSVESLAALLGHRSLSMTLVYAKIADRTVQSEYLKATQKLESLCDKASLELPAHFEGPQMAKLRQEMNCVCWGTATAPVTQT